MKLIQKIKNLPHRNLLLVVLAILVVTLFWAPVLADHCSGDSQKLGVPIDGKDHVCVGDKAENPIWVYMRAILKFLSAGVGVVVVLMIVISGIQYITSGGNPQSVQAAKSRMVNAIIALVLFIFMFAILQFLIPGGIF